MTQQALSKNQLKILEYVKGYLNDNNLSPTVREICLGTGLRSTSTVHENLKHLSDKGLIAYTPGTRRAITMRNEAKSQQEQCVNVPLVGDVAAGQPILAISNIQDCYALPKALVHGTSEGDTFMLRIKGDSMIEIGMFENDRIIVDSTASVSNGDIAVVRVNGDSVTVKRFYREKDRIRLQPENTRLQPIYVDFENVEIVGKVIGLIRNF